MTFFAYEEEKWGKVLPTYERILNSLPQTPSIENPPQSTMWPHWLFNAWMCEWVGGCVCVCVIPGRIKNQVGIVEPFKECSLRAC